MLWAALGTMRKGSVYVYDMYADIQVIEELRQIPNIAAPEIPPQEAIIFFCFNYTETGVFGMKDPCAFLDQIEEVGNEIVPFYKLIISEGANVHLNPNRNTGIVELMTESTGISTASSSIISLAQEIYKESEKIDKSVDETLDFWPVRWGIIDVDKERLSKYKAAIRKIKVLTTDVAETKITKRVLETLDQFW